MTHDVQTLLRIGRNTADLDRAIRFYRGALGFRVDEITEEPPAWTRLPEVDVTPTRCAVLSLGAQQIELTEFRDAEAYPANSSACDLWFQHCAIVVGDMRAAYARVMERGAKPITHDGPQALPPATGSVTAFKFRDPDGHPLELLAFPPGAGDPVWENPHATQASLGIDHSAISVSAIARSIAFYELLGLHVAAHGVNQGIEQQQLDDLVDVEVDVITMKPDAWRTPHLELLGYRHPRGRSNPASLATAVAADRLAWQVNAVAPLLEAVADAGFPDAILGSGCIDGTTIVLLRDPDGHLVVLDEPGSVTF
jgi:catechol 2,3-dioxygenase-like lactoylglutathione lyase family enzyme